MSFKKKRKQKKAAFKFPALVSVHCHWAIPLIVSKQEYLYAG